MDRIVTQSLFHTERAETRSWQSYITSAVVHVCLIALLLAVTFPAVREIVKPAEHVTLIAPVLQTYKPKTVPPPVVHHLTVPKDLIARVTPPRRVLTPPVIKPPEQKPQQILAKAPELRLMQPAPTHNIPEAKIEAPAPPKPEIHTGVFTHEELAKGPKQPQNLKVGGFGDPNGTPAANAQEAKLQMAKVGGFDMPNGQTPGGGGGRSQSGSVHAAGFGDSAGNSPSGTGSRGTVKTGGFGSGDPNGVPGGTGTHGTVRTGDFGASAAAPTQTAQARPVQPSTTSVEILFKPRPVYTAEARQLRLEGQVSLEVVFLADGGVKVVRVVHGLGHGLDEAAEQAALQVRFRPATRSGVPVDTSATIYITFQLA